MRNSTDVVLHLLTMPVKTHVSWVAKVGDDIAVRHVAAVDIEGLAIFFDDPAQIDQVQAVLSEAAERLRALKAPPVEAVPGEHNCQHPGCVIRAVAQCESGTECDRWFCSDHGTKGGDRQVQDVGAVAYPSQCWMHWGYNVDDDAEHSGASGRPPAPQGKA